MKDEKKKKVGGTVVGYEVGYCGRYCRMCHSEKDAMRKAAMLLLDQVKNHIGVARTINRKGGKCEETIKGLEILSKYACMFNCKGGGGWSGCQIRKCCVAKGFNFCYECPDFACKENWGKWKAFSDAEIKQLQEMKEIGMKEWIKKQWK